MMTDGRQRFLDRLYVLLLGAAIAALAWFWRFDSTPPDLMDDLAAAAGLRPPTGPLGLLWQHIAAPLCRNYGLATAEVVLRTAGHVSLGVFALLSSILLEMMLPATLLRGMHVASWWRRAVRFVLFQGIILLCCADPVWNAFRWFSPLSLRLLIVAFAVILFLEHLRTDRRFLLFATFAVLGLLAADTPIGAVLFVVVLVALGVRRHLRNAGVLETPEESPFARAFMSLRLTLAFGIGLFAGVALEVYAFSSLDGLAAFDWTWGDYALEVPILYIKALLSSVSPAGAALILAGTVLPVVIEFQLIRRATDDEKHLAYVYGAAFAAFGVIAFSQLAGAKSLWFWTWGGGCVADGLLKCIAVYLCALSAVWSLAVFVIELFLRNFRRIETLRFPDALEAEDAAPALASAKRLQRIVRAVFLLEPIIVLACVVPFRSQRVERAMLSTVDAVVRETVEECRDVRWLFTDGGLDVAVELAAAAEGHELNALSMMGAAAESREIYIRTRGVTNAVDKALLESGAADALRMWVRTRPDKALEYAVQIGFELWRRDGRAMPRCSGLVARPEGLSDEEAERGASAARNLAKRVLALYARWKPDKVADRRLHDAFIFAQWRLAILSRHRANAYDERGERDLAMEETRLADELDKKNAALARIRATMAWASRKKLERMTPQEGLRAGLARADFARARIFAQQVLAVDLDNPEANFALGMDYFVQKQYARAQVYLERCLKLRPNDPAVLNNLAQCHLRQGDFKGAMPYAERALEALPDSPEIKRTIERIEKGMQKEASGENGKKECGTP